MVSVEEKDFSRKRFFFDFFSIVDKFRKSSNYSIDSLNEYSLSFQRLYQQLQQNIGELTETEYNYLIQVLQVEIKNMEKIYFFQSVINQM